MYFDYIATESTEIRIACTIITNNNVLRLLSGYVSNDYLCVCVRLTTNFNNLSFSRTAVPQYPASPIFSLQIDPLPADPSILVNNPIMIMFDVVRK